jgi:hypothetical protein
LILVEDLDAAVAAAVRLTKSPAYKKVSWKWVLSQ